MRWKGEGVIGPRQGYVLVPSGQATAHYSEVLCCDKRFCGLFCSKIPLYTIVTDPVARPCLVRDRGGYREDAKKEKKVGGRHLDAWHLNSYYRNACMHFPLSIYFLSQYERQVHLSTYILGQSVVINLFCPQVELFKRKICDHFFSQVLEYHFNNEACPQRK